MRNLYSCLCTFLFLAGLGLAQESGGFVQQGAHVHGAAQLNIAQDANNLLIELISPAMNIVGFEYQPSRDEDIALLESALNTLSQPDNLLALSEQAECRLSHFEVKTDMAIDQEDHHEHGDEDHDDKHDESGKKSHDHADDKHAEHDHAEHEHTEEAHSEFHAEYTFACEHPEKLVEINLSKLFNLYPGIEDLDLQYALEKGQGAAELSADNPLLRF